MTIDVLALAAKAVALGADQTQTTTGGGDYTPPAAGPTRLRFISYVEIGKHSKKVKGIAKTTDRVLLTFELSGKNHPPIEVDGVKQPIRITIDETLSLNEKANFIKLFNRMNYAGDAQHMAQLLGRAYKAEVVHDKWTGTDGKERVSAQLRSKEGYTIQPPRVEDDEAEGGWRVLEVAPAISPLKVFFWGMPDKDQWASLFIEGEYPERKDEKTGKVTAPAKSKNVLQNKIKSALNFKGSPIYNVIAELGGNLDIPEPEHVDDEPGNEPEDTPPPSSSTTSPSSVDPLTGIV